MFPRALRIARIRGIEVRIDPTWLIVAVLVVWSFLTRFTHGERSGTVALVMAVAAALGFFGSVLAHEFAHALEARHRGLEVHGITLFLFGGVTEMDMRTRSAQDEFSVAAVGPYTSLVLAAALGLVTTGIDEYVPALGDISLITGTLAWINLGLALFNLVPGAPLDGGRVLRALLWRAFGDRHRAALLAARGGQVIAALLWGLAGLMVVTRPAALFSALWLAFIGWFMFNAARTERLQADVMQTIEGRTARAFSVASAATLPPDVPLAMIDRQLAATPTEDLYPVVDSGPEGPVIVGAVTAETIEAVEPFDRGFRTVRDVMTPADELARVAADAPLLDLLMRLHDDAIVAIEDEGTIVAVIDRRRADAALRRLRRLEHPGPRAAAAGVGPDQSPPPPPDAP